MLTLPEFEFVRPRSLDEACAALEGEEGEALLIAGGTDLLPNMKHGLFTPRRLVSLRGVSELREIRETDEGGLVLGAGVTLSSIASHPLVRARYGAFAKAAGVVAGPQIRNMATLGGNVCLDTRCSYYNQTEFWRGALGYCIKKDGTICHVVPKGQKCVAAASADTPTALLVYGAKLRLVSRRGERWVDLDAFFVNDGIRNNTKAHDEILAAVALPPAEKGAFAAYHKFSLRKAIDFPLLSIALSVQKTESEKVAGLKLAVGALTARPRLMRLNGIALGRPLTPEFVSQVAEEARKQCHPLLSVAIDPTWRRDIIPVCVRRAFDELAPATAGGS